MGVGWGGHWDVFYNTIHTDTPKLVLVPHSQNIADNKYLLRETTYDENLCKMVEMKAVLSICRTFHDSKLFKRFNNHNKQTGAC